MVSPLTIFRLVVDGTFLDFDFTYIIVTLKIGGVVNGIPQAPFNCTVKFDGVVHA